MHHQKEADIERKFIEKLTSLGYKYRDDIKDRHSLEANFRKHFNNLNQVNLSNKEFASLKANIIKDDIFEVSKILRTENYMEREDGTPLYYTLVNIDRWCKNEFEVVNQLRINTENSYHRYDVIILINGIPLVQIELKEYETSPKKAMEQIVKYKNDIGNGYTNSLLCFIQLFIVSNEIKTFYFANNRDEFFKFDEDERFLPVCTYAYKNNKKIDGLHEFADEFLGKCSLAEMISKYIVLVETEKRILAMRPYQIYAVKEIIDCIKDNRGNGYIWHTTGSGKTLTSFKAATLLKENRKINKCLFVVDRKDLDSQTRDEFNKFQENCVEENTNTKTLVKRLLSNDKKDKIIVTTLQKLGIALNINSKQNFKKAKKDEETYAEQLKPIKNKRFVIIFDECHRSQFGDYHRRIKEFFPNSQLFGFTGTPIFEENATQEIITAENKKRYLTTEYIFQNELHQYTITNAIADDNVLKFNFQCYDKSGEFSENLPEKIRKEKLVDAILKMHNSLTDHKRFNAIFATAKISEAIEYYKIFKEKIEIIENKEDKINIVCIFSPPAEGNSDIRQLQEDLEQEKEDNKENQEEKKEALKEIIADYNKQYNTNFDLGRFDEYYKNIQRRIKDHQYPNKDYSHNNKIDIVIVVDMLLTGFDSKYLNTLYVDKNLKDHGLIQAFSRTNRILNSAKPHGNIIDFRMQQDKVDNAIRLFSGLNKQEESKSWWLTESYSKVAEKLKNNIINLKELFNEYDLDFSPSEVYNLNCNTAKIKFIECFKKLQKTKFALDQYVQIDDKEKAIIEEMLPEKEMLAFREAYLNIAKELINKQASNHGDNQEELTEEDIEKLENIDFEFTLFSSVMIDFDYILDLITKSTKIKDEKEYAEQIETIKSYISTIANLKDEKEYILPFIETLPKNEPLTKEDIVACYKIFKEEKNNSEIKQVAENFQVNTQELIRIVNDTIRQKSFRGDMLEGLFPENMHWKERAIKEEELMAQFIPILKKTAGDDTIRGLEVYD